MAPRLPTRSAANRWVGTKAKEDWKNDWPVSGAIAGGEQHPDPASDGENRPSGIPRRHWGSRVGHVPLRDGAADTL
jgi:hypothetical protein